VSAVNRSAEGNPRSRERGVGSQRQALIVRLGAASGDGCGIHGYAAGGVGCNADQWSGVADQPSKSGSTRVVDAQRACAIERCPESYIKTGQYGVGTENHGTVVCLSAYCPDAARR